MRRLILAVAVLAIVGCEQQKDIDIPTARVRADLALSAFECSELAPDKASASRLFNVGINAGRDFLRFAETNDSGYQSIQSDIHPVWTAPSMRPSADFRLGEIYAATRRSVLADRGRWNDAAWQSRKNELYKERNCAFLGDKPAQR